MAHTVTTSDYVHTEYPKYVFAPGKRCLVHNKAEEDALGGGWAESPSALAVQHDLESQPPSTNPVPVVADITDPPGGLWPNIKTAAEAIPLITSVEVLEARLAAEKLHPDFDGGRTTILHALKQRIRVLVAPDLTVPDQVVPADPAVPVATDPAPVTEPTTTEPPVFEEAPKTDGPS